MVMLNSDSLNERVAPFLEKLIYVKLFGKMFNNYLNNVLKEAVLLMVNGFVVVYFDYS